MLEVEIENPGANGWYGGLSAVPGVSWVECRGQTLCVSVGDLARDTSGVLGWLVSQGYRCSHLASQRADLETVFLTLTGRSVRNA
jgi:ABC-2 type transport system ATP-binding protein